MILIRDYVVVSSLDEAHNLLQQRRSNTLLGGGAFLGLSSKKIGTAIDLSQLNLDFILEEDKTIEIGAMTTFRQIETSPLLHEYFNGILPHSVTNIGGVQLRNIVTVGGTIYPRYGFSDLLTALMVLEADIVLFKGGQLPLREFLEYKTTKDIIVKIIIPKNKRCAKFSALRNSQSDYALLNVAVSCLDNQWLIAVGARPQRAKIALEASLSLSRTGLTPQNIEHAALKASQELTFGTNMRGGKEYRKAISSVLIKRAIMEVKP